MSLNTPLLLEVGVESIVTAENDILNARPRCVVVVFAGPYFYLLQPFLVSSNPSNKRSALAPANVSSRCGWPFSTV
jgi:hypothetical protein